MCYYSISVVGAPKLRSCSLFIYIFHHFVCQKSVACSKAIGSGSGSGSGAPRMRPVFLFFYFLLSFFAKIYFRFGNLQEYTPAAPLPGGRDLAARQWGGRGFCAKLFAQIIALRSLGAGRPAAGRPALPPLYKGWLVPHTSFASLKFQKPRKERESGEALPDFRAGDCR